MAEIISSPTEHDSLILAISKHGCQKQAMSREQSFSIYRQDRNNEYQRGDGSPETC